MNADRNESIVSDHAVIRYWERIMEMEGQPTKGQIRQIRAKIETDELRKAARLGLRHYTAGGATFRIRRGFVLTVTPPSWGAGKPRKKTRRPNSKRVHKQIHAGGFYEDQGN